MNKNLQLYEKYFVQNNSERPELFRVLKDRYNIESAIYPGSFVHITPSLVFNRTAYIDNDRRVQDFFDDPEVLNWVEAKKDYKEKPTIMAYQQDYSKKLPVDIGKFDLLISQYAGFVSQECKQYLKPNGLLLVNSSHGDASLAYLDPDYELIAVVNNNGKWVIKDTGLDEYFVPKKPPHPPKVEILKNMMGVGYKKTASNYIFQKKTKP